MNNNLVKMHEDIFDDFLDQYKKDKNWGLTVEKNNNKKIKKFIKDFNIAAINNMGLKDYEIGTGSHNSFCYKLEWELRSVGSILGSPAYKYGVFFSKKNKRDEINTKYKNSNANEVLELVKKDILTIINAAKQNNLQLILDKKVTLPYTVTFKIYNTYNYKNDLPIFSYEHLKKIIEAYDIEYDKNIDYGLSMRLALLKFKNDNPVFSKASNYCFMSFLYSDMSKLYLKSDSRVSKNRKNEEVEIKEVTELIDYDKAEKTYSDEELDWGEIANKKSYIGEQGQDLVLKKEKEDKPQYKNKIKDVSSNPRIGYDIESFALDGSPMHIEVKTKVNGSKMNVDFLITLNELHKMETDPYYYIYYVCGIKKKCKTIYVITRNLMDGIKKKPVLFRINGRII